MRMLLIAVIMGWANVVLAQPTDTTWTVILGGQGTDFATSIQSLPSGDFVVGGAYYSPSNPHGGFLAALTEDGDTLFTRILGDSGITDVFQVCAIDSATFTFSGSSYRLGFGTRIVVGKMSLLGQLEWLHHYDNLNAWIGFDLVYDEGSQQLVIVGGKPFSGSTQDAVIFKTDINGDTLWSRAFGGGSCEHFESVIRSCDGGYVAAGIDCAANAGAFRVILAKVTADGDSLWANYLGPDPRSWAHDMCLTPDCGFLIVGEYDTNDQDSQVLAIKTDSLGNEIWTRTYGGSESDKCYGVRALSAGGYLLCGSTTSYGHGSIDTYLLNINEEGDTVWTETYGTDYPEYARSLIIEDNSDIVIAGEVQQDSVGSSPDLFVTRMGISHDTQRPERHERSLVLESSSFPNPFNPMTTISFDLDHPGMVRLKVFDITGREVSSLVEESMTAGTHAVTFDGAGLASGIYFYSLQCGERKLTKKMVLIR
jgi:hypothetical protein